MPHSAWREASWLVFVAIPCGSVLKFLLGTFQDVATNNMRGPMTDSQNLSILQAREGADRQVVCRSARRRLVPVLFRRAVWPDQIDPATFVGRRGGGREPAERA